MSNKANKTRDLCELVRIFESHFADEGKKRGLFGIEARAGRAGREVEVQSIREELLKLDRGYEGAVRTCPKCGKKQRYGGDRERVVTFECGEFKVQRAYYSCNHCGTSSVPLDEKLGIVEGREQGKLREKLSMIGVLTSYHQSPQVCETLLGHGEHAATIRRCVSRESKRLSDIEELPSLVNANESDTLYLEIDGHMCPTREEKKTSSDQGYREAKVVMAFKASDVSDISKDRNEILNLKLRGEIASANDFMGTVSDVYERVNGKDAGRVVILGDGATWIWNIASEVMPGAVQILDYSHAKSYLYQAAENLYGSDSDLSSAWVRKQKERLFDNQVDLVITDLKQYVSSCPALQTSITYFENNRTRMLYGKYRADGLMIGSGAIESAGKRIAQGSIKGCGMRWNVSDLNDFLKLRCSFLDRSWKDFWETQYALAA